MWAAVPSSGWGAVPCKATKINTVASAPKDIATGRNALGRLSIVDEFISPTYDFAVGGVTYHCYDKALCDNAQPTKRQMLTNTACALPPGGQSAVPAA
jgi:hypothetical protein